MVLVCVPPPDLLAAVDERRSDSALDQEIDEGSEHSRRPKPSATSFHDLLKAQGMALAVPIQMVRPKTYTGERRRKRHKNKFAPSIPLQDAATRAWNIHAALYYKAGEFRGASLGFQPSLPPVS